VVEDLPDLPTELLGPVEALAQASDSELAFYEERFLIMQKAIFDDMGAMHEAYLGGGMEAIEEMLAAGIIDEDTRDSWLNVESGVRTGDASYLHEAARGLAHREQFDIIGDHWDSMRDHALTGPGVTYLMTVVGKPSLPEARFPGEVSTLIVPVTPSRVPVYDPADLPLVPGVPFFDLPDAVELPAQVKVRTTLPDFNVSDRDQRWAYFTSDTLPRYVELLDEQGRVRELTEQDLAQRLAAERLGARLPDVLAQLDPRQWRPVVE